MNKKYIKENKSLIKEFLGALIKAVAKRQANKLVKDLRKQSPENAKAIDENEEWIEEVEGKVGKNKDLIADVEKKMNMAYKMGNYQVLEQLQFRMEELKLELSERLEKERFEIINQRTPDSLTIGEDDGKSEDPDSST